MGNVFAAGPSVMPAPPPMPPGPSDQQQASPQASAQEAPLPPPEETGPGTFEDLHKKCKDIFPMPFEGAKLIINKGLSNHFQISHTLTMSTMQPSGYRFGATYVGTKQISPQEAYPVLIGDVDPGSNLNANIIHQFTKAIRSKFVTQIQGGKWMVTQVTADYKGEDFAASLTTANPDIISGSGVMVAHYLQNVTSRLALGAELVYQCGAQLPGGQMGIYTLGGRYSADKWQVSANVTPQSSGAHVCYYHKISDMVQVGVEIEGGLRTGECTTTVGYQLDHQQANLTFKGQLDSNLCVTAVLEKRLPPLPFTFALSGFANHNKAAYRFGLGLIVG